MKIYMYLLLAAFILSCGQKKNEATVKHSFTLSDSSFLLDGKPFVVISGEMHYPRIPKEAWRQRMQMAKAMGINTISTYVFWNVHEPQKGQYDFSGENDVVSFIKTAEEEGLWVILRPSPYVCAEWEFGGYPYWLLNENLKVRSKDSAYLDIYKKYLNEIGKRLAPLQINHGGNILMTQIENEYGSYGSDKEYLDINRKIFIDAGFDGLLNTADPEPAMAGGSLAGVLPAINGEDNPVKVKKLIRDNNNGKGPFFIGEWYPAWFDWWGTKHHTIPAEGYAKKLDSVLAAGISINMYMFHGGTTRGFMNGANYKDETPYEPQISSYDYDAPLDEAGNATPKFMKFREAILKNLPAGTKLPDVPKAKPAINIPNISFNQLTSIFEALPTPVENPVPLTFEQLKQAYGYVLYRNEYNSDGKAGTLNVKELRDYGIVYVNGARIDTFNRMWKNVAAFNLTLPKGKVTIDILVENMGRINFGKYLLDNHKGITKSVTLNGTELKGWKMYSLPFSDLNNIKYTNNTVTGNQPVIKKGSFNLTTVADSYLDMSQWGKGVVWVNGHNLGRYWYVGPQQTIYVPAEWLRKGDNEIVVFEMLKPTQDKLSGIDHPVLDRLQ